MAKNIALVTWIGTGNYGTSFQSYALYKVLRNLGCRPYFLKMISLGRGWKDIIQGFISMLGLYPVSLSPKNLKGKEGKLARFNAQRYSYKEVYSWYQYRLLIRTTDRFLTGSDQIWNTHFRYDPFMFLNFVDDNTKKVAYASSIGTDHVPEQYRDAVRSHLMLFRSIGVREQTAVRVLTELTGRKDIVQVVDPTFLLSAAEWTSLASEAEIEFQLPKKYILCYLLGNNPHYPQAVKRLSEQSGVEDIILIPALENQEIDIPGVKIYSEAGPIEFLYLLQHASLVCTDSFHATALSINLEKEFVELLRFLDDDKLSQNSRIYDLLEHYRLSHRVMRDQVPDLSPIDYSSVRPILKQDVAHSLDYLKTSVGL